MKSNLSTLPEWLFQPFFEGSDKDADEDSSNEDDDEDNDDEDEDEDSDEDESDEDEDSDGEDEDEDKSKEDPAAGLKSALRKERKGHKAEKRARIAAEQARDEFKAALDGKDGKENEAVATLQKELDSERTKVTSLATKIKDQAVSNAIINEARKLGFVDPEDALSVAKAIEADQDADDPTDIDIDEDSVKTAVAGLAKRKKHLLGKKLSKTQEETKQTRSGTKSTRRRSTKSSKQGEKKLEELYPGL